MSRQVHDVLMGEIERACKMHPTPGDLRHLVDAYVSLILNDPDRPSSRPLGLDSAAVFEMKGKAQ